MKKRQRGLKGLVCAALSGLLILGGCGFPKEAAPIKEPNLPKNDGAPAKLTISVGGGEGREWMSYSRKLPDALEEIIAKYEADFPNTEIVLSENEPDIRLFIDGELKDTEGLMDLTPYKDAWELEGSITNPAGRIMHFMGGESIYAIPFQYDQIMLYYRFDWIDEYNQGRPANERAAVDLWGNLLDVPGKLGEKGGLVIAGEVRPLMFDVLLWSWTDPRLIADWAAGYYQKDGSTIFNLESSLNAANAFKRLLDAETASEDPMGDFIDGRACMYIGRGLDMRELREKMPGELGVSWRSIGLPQGTGGKVAPLLEWTAWGVSSDTPEPEKAAHFLWYLTNADNNTHLYMELANSGVKPIYREAEAFEPSLLEGCWQGEIELLNMPNYKYASAPAAMGELAGAKNPEFKRLFSRLADGEISPEEMLEGLDGEYKRLLEEYRQENGRLPWEQEDREDKT